MTTKLKKEQSKAQKIKILLKKYDGRFKSYMEMSSFEEPVVFLLRNNRRAEFYEKATSGKFIFIHTDGKERSIDLSPQFLHTFDYGKRNFKGYVCHEDFPTPLPEIPVVTGEMYQMGIEKTLNDFKKWKADETRAIGDMWWKILLGLGAVILAIGAVKLLVPSLSLPFFANGNGEAIQKVAENTTAIVRNITKLP